MKDMKIYGNRYLVLHDFPMLQLNRAGVVRVFLPANYYNCDVRYPVLYLQDGQNIFEHASAFGNDTWGVPLSVDTFCEHKNYPGIIVVAIDNASAHGRFARMDEYSPWPRDNQFSLPDWDPAVDFSGGKGERYADFIAYSLKPYIDRHYRTLPDRSNTAIAGSSMGAYISLFSSIYHQDTFSKVGVFSPALWFNEASMLAFIRSSRLHTGLTVYLDVGTHESSGAREDFPEVYITGADKLCACLRHLQGIKIDYHIWAGHRHCETAWAKRFPLMLELFYG